MNSNIVTILSLVVQALVVIVTLITWSSGNLATKGDIRELRSEINSRLDKIEQSHSNSEVLWYNLLIFSIFYRSLKENQNGFECLVAAGSNYRCARYFQYDSQH